MTISIKAGFKYCSGASQTENRENQTGSSLDFYSSFGSSESQTCGPSTHSAILFPSSRLGGCELAVKTTRPPLVSFMALDFWPLLSSHSGSGSLGTHAALTPSCSLEGWGHTLLPLEYKIKLIFENTIAGWGNVRVLYIDVLCIKVPECTTSSFVTLMMFGWNFKYHCIHPKLILYRYFPKVPGEVRG